MCNTSGFTGQLNYFRVCGQQRRKGLLCGECEDGLGPAVMSYTHPCVECQWYGWLLYIALSFIPATTLCCLIILLRINVLSPPLNAAVLFCQMVTTYVNLMPCSFLYNVDIHQASKFAAPILTFYGFFNMDFFVYVVPPFCISNNMSIFAVISLDYIVALYPLSLAVVIYVLIEVHDGGCKLFNFIWRPFHKCLVHFRKSWDIKGSIINAFATLYVLSFTKVISTSVGLTSLTDVENMCGQYYHRTHLYYNASCSFFQLCHRPYAYLMIVVSTIFIAIPSLYILLYPCKSLHKCNFLNLRIMLLPKEVTKIFHHSFKDGTKEGTLDCRWFAGVYLLIRIMIALSVNFKGTRNEQILISILGMLLVSIFQPHTRTVFNCMDSLLFGGLAMILLLWPAGQSKNIAQVLIFFLPLLVLLLFVFCKMIKKLTTGGKLKACYLFFQGIRFRELSARSTTATDQEQKPLLDKDNSPAATVSYTVVDIKSDRLDSNNCLV